MFYMTGLIHHLQTTVFGEVYLVIMLPSMLLHCKPCPPALFSFLFSFCLSCLYFKMPFNFVSFVIHVCD